MFNQDGYSLSDIAAVSNNDNFGGGNFGAYWIIILFLFMFMGWGGNNGNNRQAASTDDVQNQFNFAALERQNNEIVDAVRQSAYDVTGAVKDMGYANGNQIRDIEAMVASNGHAIDACCCTTQRNIDSVRYDMSLNTREIMANDCQNTQKILDAISTNRMADMQNQINQLQLQSALCGVIRYPLATTYSAGYAPYYNQGCCNQC